MSSSCERCQTVHHSYLICPKYILRALGVSALVFGLTGWSGKSVLADEFPPYPERSDAIETCKQAVADFYHGRPSKAAVENSMSDKDVLAMRNI